MSSKFKIDDGTEVGCECNISNIITQRLREKNVRFFGNDNISEHVTSDEISALVDEVAGKMESVLRSLVIDVDNDHNTRDTARRVAKMFVNETFSGRYQPPPRVTSFPNSTTYDELYVTGPITVRSTCAHHLQPIKGKCYIGVFPGTNVIGLSKFNRIVDWISSRPTIQEELTVQIADEIQRVTEAQGVAVLLQAEHGCMTNRGVREESSDMTTSVMRGVLRDHPHIKQEFFNIVSRMK
jgi:GTP cyclohydrolase IA